jgi:hypothetical protein
MHGNGSVPTERRKRRAFNSLRDRTGHRPRDSHGPDRMHGLNYSARRHPHRRGRHPGTLVREPGTCGLPSLASRPPPAPRYARGRQEPGPADPRRPGDLRRRDPDGGGSGLRHTTRRPAQQPQTRFARRLLVPGRPRASSLRALLRLRGRPSVARRGRLGRMSLRDERTDHGPGGSTAAQTAPPTGRLTFLSREPAPVAWSCTNRAMRGRRRRRGGRTERRGAAPGLAG